MIKKCVAIIGGIAVVTSVITGIFVVDSRYFYAADGRVIKDEIKTLYEKKVDNRTLQLMIEAQTKLIQLQIEQQKKDSDRLWDEVKDLRKDGKNIDK